MELYFKTRMEWRSWLEKNHSTSRGTWIIYYKKPSGKPRIPYNEAVEEALCFGWIDGKIKSINKDYFIQHFTPRRSGSRWSKYNIDRVRKLIKGGRMEPAGLKAFKEAVERPGLIYERRSNGEPLIPLDLMDAFRKNIRAYENFKNFPPSSRRIFIEWLNSAKKPETRPRRIEKIVGLSEKNIKSGMTL
jgi:uncharacterized protein YdeI (YjbR/CyaY-like superfamily)